MKKLLSITLLLLSTSAFAQKWSVGFNYGGVWNTKPLNHTPDITEPDYKESSSLIANAMSLGVNYHITPEWQVGLAFEYQNLNYRYFNKNGIAGFHDGTHYLSPLSVAGKVNRVFTAGRMQYYGGVNAGLVKVSLDDEQTGFRSGIQIGGNLSVFRRWVLNGELGGNYFNVKDFGDISNVISTSATLGIHYYF